MSGKRASAGCSLVQHSMHCSRMYARSALCVRTTCMQIDMMTTMYHARARPELRAMKRVDTWFLQTLSAPTSTCRRTGTQVHCKVGIWLAR